MLPTLLIKIGAELLLLDHGTDSKKCHDSDSHYMVNNKFVVTDARSIVVKPE